jgi:hypothetical protein
MVRVSSFELLEGHRIRLTFTNGRTSDADLGPVLRGPLDAVREPGVFRRAFLEHGALTWPGDIAIAPETVYALAFGLDPRDWAGTIAHMKVQERG